MYRRFFIKVVVFAILLVVLDGLCGVAFRKLEGLALIKSPYGMTTEYTMSVVNTDVVIIGSSETQHSYIPQILEDSLGFKVYNCGQDGCLFYYKNAVVHGILDRYTPKVIIWDITPNELSTKNGDVDNSLSKLNPYYKQSSFMQNHIGVVSKYEKLKMISECYTFNSRLFVYLYKIVMPDYAYQYGGYNPLSGSKKGLSIKERSWEGEFDQKKEDIFRKTIERCKSSGVKLVFAFVPRLEIEDHNNLPSYKSIVLITKEYEIPLIEEFYHVDELMSPHFFKDNAHLNNEGAMIYSQMFSSRLKQIIK